MIRNRGEVRLFAALRPLLLENTAAVASGLARFQGRHVFSFVRYGSGTPGTWNNPLAARRKLFGIVSGAWFVLGWTSTPSKRLGR